MKRTINHTPSILLRPSAGLAAAVGLFLWMPGGAVMAPVAYAQVETDGLEVLTRGPVHEAFAGTISFKATPGLMVAKAPPAIIEELPPDQRPEGDNVTWIPGYWAWDDDSSDFLWVSGIWRNLPPGRQWIPGYWWESGSEYQWISGYWADAEVEEVEYLSEPPASIEAGPNVDAPSRNHTWIPGTWRWRTDRYAWQPGYWYEAQPEWVWVPSYYAQTPRGYVYVDGYYDYEVERRGIIFAPVRFSRGYDFRPDYRYRPETVISLSVFVDHLFLRPRNRHYYFGDYYAPRYRESGYYSSYNYYSGGYGYDPIYAHKRWTHREDRNWEQQRVERYNYFRENEDARPPHTLTALTSFLSGPGRNRDRNRSVDAGFATNLQQWVSRKDNSIRFKTINEGERQDFAQRSRAIREFSEQRRQETRARYNPDRSNSREQGDRENGPRPDKGAPERGRLPKSPVVARFDESDGKVKGPPRRPNGNPSGERKNRQEDRKASPESSNLPDGTDRRDGKDRPEGKDRPDGNDRPNGNDRPDNKDGPNKPRNPDEPDRNRDSRPDKNRPEVQPRDPGGEKKPEPRMPNVEPKERPRDLPEPKPNERPRDMPDPRGSDDNGRKNNSQPKRDRMPDQKPDDNSKDQPDRGNRTPKSSPEQPTDRREPKAAPQQPEPRRESKQATRPDAKARPQAPKAEPRRESPEKSSRQEQPSEPRRESKKEASRAHEPPRERKAAPERPSRQESRPEPRKESRQEAKPAPSSPAPASPKKGGGGGGGGGEKEEKGKGKK